MYGNAGANRKMTAQPVTNARMVSNLLLRISATRPVMMAISDCLQYHAQKAQATSRHAVVTAERGRIPAGKAADSGSAARTTTSEIMLPPTRMYLDFSSLRDCSSPRAFPPSRAPI